jgi:hypothetical protein
MRTLILIIISLLISLTVNGYEKRDLLQKSFDVGRLKKSLVLDQKWVKYPEYQDRSGWDVLVGKHKDEIISRGEAAIDYQWQVIKATDFIEYERSGSRETMSRPFNANRSALSNLVLAELAEGKGRFLDQIANGIWFFCENTSWVASAHLPNTSLPNPDQHILDLMAGDMGSFLSWTYYFLKDELDRKVHRYISQRLRQTIQERILDAYMERDYGYLAFNATPLTKVNNWNPWVNFNVVSAYLLLENDPDKLAVAIYRSMVSVDSFINYYHDDGATEEGTSYFSHAVGKLYDYLQILSYAGVPVAPVFKEPLIRRMGEFVSKAYIGDGWVVNYSDASPRYSGPIGVIYRYGDAVGSHEMKQFASYLYHRDKSTNYIVSGSDIFRTLENMGSHQSVVATAPSTSQESHTWYPKTELLYIRDKSGFFFSAKGGTNQQSHNHNDVGSFVLFYKNKPVFIDVGVGTYTRQTFSGERYSIWTMQSNYHNVPVINGAAQRSLGLNRHPEDEKYRARNVQFNPRRLGFTADISGSYSPEAKVQKWERSYNLNRGRLVIEDDFVLTEASVPNQVNFIVQAEPDMSRPGRVRMNVDGETIVLVYDGSRFDAVVEDIPLADTRLSNVWGSKIYRLSFNARNLLVKDKYRFVIERE